MSHTVFLAPVEYAVLTLCIYEKKILRRIISLSSCPIEKLCENTVKRQNYFGVKLKPDDRYAVSSLTMCGQAACGFSVTWLVGAFFSFSIISSWASLFRMNQWEWYFFTQRFIDKITNSKAGKWIYWFVHFPKTCGILSFFSEIVQVNLQMGLH